MLILSRSEVERLLSPPDLLAGLRDGFVAYSEGRASIPPRVAAVAPAGLLAAMPGYVPGAGLEVKLVSVFHHNPEHGLPGHQGLIALFDEADGRPLAVMDGLHITAVRTGASSAVAADLLARSSASVLCVIGAGVQGRSHLTAVASVRSFAEVRVASRSFAHASALAAEFGAVAVESFEKAVGGADVVCLCTDAASPVISASWLAPGCLVASVGFNVEVPPELVSAASVFVEWRGAAASAPPAGAAELQGIAPSSVTELGEVLAGTKPGRRSESELILYKSTGLAVEDAVAARLVYARALAEGAGTEVSI